MEGAWERPSHPLEFSVHVLRKIQVKMLILGLTFREAHSFHPCRAAEEWTRNYFSRIGAFTACAGLRALCGNVFLCSRFNVCSFILLKCVCHMAPGNPTAVSVPGGEGMGSFICSMSGSGGNQTVTLCQLWDETAGMGTNAHY